MEKSNGTPMDDKYIVFKRSDFLKWWSQIEVGGTQQYEPVPEQLYDAVVIRRQDVAAPPILDAYASFYLALVDMRKEALTLLHGDEDITEEEAEQLRAMRNVADYFHAQAAEAWLTDRKLAD